MIEYLALGLASWLLLSLPFAVFVGKCISVGQAGEAARHATVAAEPEMLHADAVSAEHESATPDDETPALPAQRGPRIPAANVS